MRKKTLLLFLLATSVIMTGGCRKKSQEKMDLTSTHTTAAETMAPETTAADDADAADKKCQKSGISLPYLLFSHHYLFHVPSPFPLKNIVQNIFIIS